MKCFDAGILWKFTAIIQEEKKKKEGPASTDSRESKRMDGLTPCSQALYGVWRLRRCRVQRGKKEVTPGTLFPQQAEK